MSREESIAKLEVYLGECRLKQHQNISKVFTYRSLFTFSCSALQPLDQAIDPKLDEIEISALDAFCQIVKKEQDLCVSAARLLANKIQSLNVKESLFALDALEGNLLSQNGLMNQLVIHTFIICRMYGHARLKFPNRGEQI